MQPPRYFLPLLMALIGIAIATLAANAGQRDVRNQDFRDLAAQRKFITLQIQTVTDPSAKARLGVLYSHLISTLPNITSYHRPGRVFTNWDGYRYEEIIDDGYVYTTDASSTTANPITGEPRLKNVAWYPLYPLLGLSVSTLTGLPTHHALTAVSWLSIIAAAMVFFALARRHFASRLPQLAGAAASGACGPVSSPDTAAFWAVALLLFGPASIFLYANFTESLFVLLLASFLYALQGRRWWLAALIAAAASATRSQGVLFGPILALVYLVQPAPRLSFIVYRRLPIAFLLGVISALGLACYMLFLQQKFGDPLAFMHVQKNWDVGLNAKTLAYAANPTNAVSNFFDYLLRPELDYPRIWESFCVIAPPILLLLFGKRLLSLELNVLAWILWGLPYVSNSLAASNRDPSAFPQDLHWMSMGRFAAVMLPLHLLLGGLLARTRYLGPLLLVLSAAAFALLAYKFGTGAWIG